MMEGRRSDRSPWGLHLRCNPARAIAHESPRYWTGQKNAKVVRNHARRGGVGSVTTPEGFGRPPQTMPLTCGYACVIRGCASRTPWGRSDLPHAGSIPYCTRRWGVSDTGHLNHGAQDRGGEGSPSLPCPLSSGGTSNDFSSDFSRSACAWRAAMKRSITSRSDGDQNRSRTAPAVASSATCSASSPGNSCSIISQYLSRISALYMGHSSPSGLMIATSLRKFRAIHS